METWLQDLRFSFRMLLRGPRFALMVVVTLALGIGANTAIFSVINAVLLSPLPFPNSERLMAVESHSKRRPEAPPLVSYPNFLDWKRQNQSFESLAAYRTMRFTVTGPEGEASSVPGVVASPDLFSVLQVSPKMGRAFLPSDDQPGAGNVVLLSESLWRRRFQSDPNIVGKPINLDSRVFTIVGVAPAEFNFPVQQEPAELWVSIVYDMLNAAPGERPITASRGSHYLQVIGRLRPGVPLKQAQAEMDKIAGAINEQYASELSPRFNVVVPQLESIVHEIRPALMILFAAVGLILLIACGNVSNLLIARLAARRREFSIRAALGAGYRRIVRQLLTESLVLACLGGAGGLAVAWGAIQLFARLRPANLPRIVTVSLDMQVLGFAIGAVLLTTILFGFAPALETWRSDLAQSIKEGGYSGTEGVRHNRLRRVLVVGEVALTLMLLTGTGLLLRSLLHLQRVDPGFDPDNVLTVDLAISPGKYDDSRLVNFYERLLPGLEKLPGVRSVAGVFPLPLTNDGFNIPFEIDGRPVPHDQRPRAGLLMISTGYFRTMSVSVTDGREFSRQDDNKSSPVVVINESLGQRFFPGENPIGKYIKLGLGDKNNPPRQIVGIVGNVKSSGLSEETGAEIYVPFTQLPNPMTVVIRANVRPLSIAGAVRHEISSIDNEMAISRLKTMADYVSDSTLTPRFNGLLLSLFAAIALALTMVGLYGVISQSVTYRTREIGVRMALGAQSEDILKLILKEGILLACLGIALGLIGAFASTRLISGLLFKVSSTDPVIYLGAILFLLGLTALSSYIPARRATKVSPVVSLK